MNIVTTTLNEYETAFEFTTEEMEAALEEFELREEKGEGT